MITFRLQKYTLSQNYDIPIFMYFIAYQDFKKQKLEQKLTLPPQ
ncbi:hypothetical protein HMPREF9420_1715 [Segatella salivae DSM 15606]|uniref:Uncharacterized protein n=1 Tax=Segatella salivae DSM 15606 TaxID=888832 RepID=E6MQE7_9BACT|nr:hypothetical protein HMPREF9420_1715 [Segatella salivae DSM 15606]